MNFVILRITQCADEVCFAKPPLAACRRSKMKVPLKPYNDRGEGGAAWLSHAQLCLQLVIWKENSLLTSEMHLLAGLLRDTEHYFINPEINLNLADFVKARRAAERFQAIRFLPFTGRGAYKRFHLQSQQWQIPLFPLSVGREGSTCPAAPRAHVSHVGPLVGGGVVLLHRAQALPRRPVVAPHGVELPCNTHSQAQLQAQPGDSPRGQPKPAGMSGEKPGKGICSRQIKLPATQGCTTTAPSEVSSPEGFPNYLLAQEKRDYQSMFC